MYKEQKLFNPGSFPTEQWIQELYHDTKEKWIAEGAKPLGFAIFYSPVITNPDLMIIGLNPGGGVESYDEPMKGPLSKHDYFVQNYPIARNMRKIFEDSKLKVKLEDSVKLNLYFFRSKNWKSLEMSSHLKNFFEERVKNIIYRIQPKVILAEGFQTYKALKAFTQENIPDSEFLYSNSLKSRRIILTNKTTNNIPLIGITHPSATRGLSNKMFDQISNDLKRILI